MCPFISSLYGSLNRSFKHRNVHRIRCISVHDFQDIDDVEIEMQNNSLIVIFFKEFRIKKPMDAKRLLQRFNAFTRQYEYEILNLGKLDYFLLVPNEFELTNEALQPSM